MGMEPIYESSGIRGVVIKIGKGYDKIDVVDDRIICQVVLYYP